MWTLKSPADSKAGLFKGLKAVTGVISMKKNIFLLIPVSKIIGACIGAALFHEHSPNQAVLFN